MDKDFNKLPIIITEEGLYKLRNGEEAKIHRLDRSEHSTVISFGNYGHVISYTKEGKELQSAMKWHISGRCNPLWEMPYDVVAKSQSL